MTQKSSIEQPRDSSYPVADQEAMTVGEAITKTYLNPNDYLLLPLGRPVSRS